MSSTLPLALLTLRKDESVVILGAARIAPIIGSLSILGHDMNAHIRAWPTSRRSNPFDLASLPTPHFVDILSPSSSSLLKMTAIAPIRSSSNTHLGSQEPRLPNAVSAEHLAGCTAEIVNLLNGIPSTEYASIATVVAVFVHRTDIVRVENLLPTFKSLFSAEQAVDANNPENIANTSVLPKFGAFSGDYVNGVPAITIPELWSETSSSILSDSTDSPLSVCVTGSKNTGKSTFVRYLINRLLSK
eukprot:jgi/Hompol1/2144/HPOL_005865-RA